MIVLDEQYDMIDIYWVMALENSDHYKACHKYFKWTSKGNHLSKKFSE